MSIDPSIKRIVQRIAKEAEAMFVGAGGAIDKKALSEHALDAVEQRHPDLLPVVEREAPLWMVEEIVREMYRKTHARMKGEVEAEEGGGEEAEPRMPSYEKVKGIRLSVPKGQGSYETKALLDCALWELDVVDQDYGTRADTMLQHQGFVRALNVQARLRGFEPTDTVRKLYGVA